MSDAVNIPQANSVETLVYVVEAIAAGVDTVDDLVREFDVRERTVHYYLELAEWLGFLRDRRATQLHLTETGASFAATVGARARLYSDGVLQHELVRRALARGADRDFETLRTAFAEEIRGLDVLAEATAKRRAGALATLVQAIDAEEIDWETGRMGQPTRMRRTYAATDAPPVDEDADTTTWERPRDAVALVGAERFDRLDEQIAAVLRECGPASVTAIRDELALRFGVPLTDPAVFVVLRAGLDGARWRAGGDGRYSLP